MSETTTIRPRIIDHAGAYGDHALAVLSFLSDAIPCDDLENDAPVYAAVDDAETEIRDTFSDMEDQWGSTDSHGAYWEIVGIPAYERAEEAAEALVDDLVARWTALTGQTIHRVGDTWHIL